MFSKEYPLGVKNIEGTSVAMCTLGVAHLRGICKKLLEARKDNQEYLKLRESLEDGLNHSIFFDAFERSYNEKLEMVNFDYGIVPEKVGEIVNDCRKHGVEEITMTCSVELKILKEFTDRGCKLDGMTTIKLAYDPLDELPVNLPALIIKIN